MKRIFTLLSFGLASFAYAGTPVIDGTIASSDGYALINIANGTPGWDGTNAKTLYFTEDATHYYFAASVTASSWMSYGLIINTTAGAGASSDGWGRQITYAHTEKPDVEIRGNFDNSWSELHTWSGSAWNGTGVNYTTANAMSSITSGNGVDGAVEMRIAKSAIGTFSVMDAQFYITGNNNDHANFDAVPNDNNTTAWNGVNTSLSAYAQTNVSLPVTLVSFSGMARESVAELKWRTSNEENVSHFDIERSTNGTEWKKSKSVTASNINSGNSYSATISLSEKQEYFRLKIVDKDGKYGYSAIVTIKQGGSVKFDLASNNVKAEIRINVNADKGTVFADLTSIEGRKVASTNFNHAGGSSTINFNIGKLPKGMYVLNLVMNGERNTFRVMVN